MGRNLSTGVSCSSALGFGVQQASVPVAAHHSNCMLTEAARSLAGLLVNITFASWPPPADGTSAAVTIDELLCGSAAGPVAFDLSSPITGDPPAAAGTETPAGAAAAAGSAAEQAPRLTADFRWEVWATLVSLKRLKTSGLRNPVGWRAAMQ